MCKLRPMGTETMPGIIQQNYELHEWRHATAILQNDFPNEYADVIDVLSRLRIRKSWLEVGGGNKTELAKWIDSELGKKDWFPKNFDTQISVDGRETESPTHEIDCGLASNWWTALG